MLLFGRLNNTFGKVVYVNHKTLKRVPLAKGFRLEANRWHCEYDSKGTPIRANYRLERFGAITNVRVPAYHTKVWATFRELGEQYAQVEGD